MDIKGLCCIVAIFCVGCTQIQIPKPDPVYSYLPKLERKAVAVPSVGVDAEAAPGGSVYRQTYARFVTQKKLANDAKGIFQGITLLVPRDSPLVHGHMGLDRTNRYCTEKQYVTGDRLVTVCFDGSDDTVHTVILDIDPKKTRIPLVQSVKVLSGEEIRPDDNSLVKELLYQGYSHGTLRLTYREYLDGMPRPSFFQEVTYDISSFPSEISFQDVKLRLISADNTRIRYPLLSGFPVKNKQ